MKRFLALLFPLIIAQALIADDSKSLSCLKYEISEHLGSFDEARRFSLYVPLEKYDTHPLPHTKDCLIVEYGLKLVGPDKSEAVLESHRARQKSPFKILTATRGVSEFDHGIVGCYRPTFTAGPYPDIYAGGDFIFYERSSDPEKVVRHRIRLAEKIEAGKSYEIPLKLSPPASGDKTVLFFSVMNYTQMRDSLKGADKAKFILENADVYSLWGGFNPKDARDEQKAFLYILQNANKDDASKIFAEIFKKAKNTNGRLYALWGLYAAEDFAKYEELLGKIEEYERISCCPPEDKSTFCPRCSRGAKGILAYALLPRDKEDIEKITREANIPAKP